MSPSAIPSKRTVLAVAAAGLLLIVGGYAVWQAWPRLFPAAVEQAPLPQHCDLRQAACNSRFASGHQVTLSIAPRDLPLMTPLTLRVKSDLPGIRQVAVDISGRNMNMGYNRPALEKDVDNHYRGTGILPVCSADRMDWEARVMLTTDSGLKTAPFHFSTFRQ